MRVLQSGAEKVDHHADCEHNWRKLLLLNNGFILVECKIPEIGSGDDKDVIFFAILVVLNILCDVIHDVIDKGVYVWRICQLDRVTGQFGNLTTASVGATKGGHIVNNILISVLRT